MTAMSTETTTSNPFADDPFYALGVADAYDEHKAGENIHNLLRRADEMLDAAPHRTRPREPLRLRLRQHRPRHPQRPHRADQRPGRRRTDMAGPQAGTRNQHPPHPQPPPRPEGPRRMNRRYAATAAFALTLAAGAVLTPADARGTTRPVTSGTGWTLAKPVTHIDTRPWTIGFHDTKSRTKLTPYLKKTAAELTTRLGVKITVSSRIIPTRRGTCGPTHTITFRYMSKPNPAKPNESFAGGCNVKGRADSGYAFINSDYWAKGRRISEGQRMNLIWHEAAHTIGLHHPAKCPTDKKTGRKPLMCDVNSYRSLSSRRFTVFEDAAFKQLRANRARVR